MIETIPMEIDSNFMQILLAFPLLFFGPNSVKSWKSVFDWYSNIEALDGCVRREINVSVSLRNICLQGLRHQQRFRNEVLRNFPFFLDRCIRVGFCDVAKDWTKKWYFRLNSKVWRRSSASLPLPVLSTVAAKRIKGNYEIFPRVQLCNQAHLSIYRYWTSIV